MTVRATFKPPSVTLERPASRAARLLALAHYVERLVEDSAVRNYAEVAGALGLTRARMSQVLALTGLSPRVQEAVLMGERKLTDHSLRPLVALALWTAQESEL